MSHFALWGPPQWIWVALTTFLLLASAFLHGQPKRSTKHDFFEQAFFVGLGAGLLWWGGFFP